MTQENLLESVAQCRKLRFAAHDPRIKAIASKSTYSSMYYLMNEDSPRYKQLFAFLTQSQTEAELDEKLQAMTLDGRLSQIACPTLMITGEYDLRDPVEEVFEKFDQLRAPGELWVFADQFHRPHFAGDGSLYAGLNAEHLIFAGQGQEPQHMGLRPGQDHIAAAAPGQHLHLQQGAQ